MTKHTAFPVGGGEALSAAIVRARLNEIHDFLSLALDATESRHGYTQAQREARSYIGAALRNATKLMESAGAAEVRAVSQRESM